MNYYEIINKDEKIIMTTSCSLKKCIGAKLLSNIVMWLLMNGFFLYLITLQKIAYKYWFVCVPIIGFDVLGALAIYICIFKYYNSIADNNYILTDKAVYLYVDNTYKLNKRLSFESITRFEKDKSNPNIFYVCTKNDFIKIENIKNSNTFYSELAKMVNSL